MPKALKPWEGFLVLLRGVQDIKCIHQYEFLQCTGSSTDYIMLDMSAASAIYNQVQQQMHFAKLVIRFVPWPILVEAQQYWQTSVLLLSGLNSKQQ